MDKKANIQGYLEYVHAPWGRLFYKLAWHNIECKGKRILDFGSGFGITADHFAKYNNVIAVEPNKDMLKFILIKLILQSLQSDTSSLPLMHLHETVA